MRPIFLVLLSLGAVQMVACSKKNSVEKDNICSQDFVENYNSVGKARNLLEIQSGLRGEVPPEALLAFANACEKLNAGAPTQSCTAAVANKATTATVSNKDFGASCEAAIQMKSKGKLTTETTDKATTDLGALSIADTAGMTVTFRNSGVLRTLDSKDLHLKSADQMVAMEGEIVKMKAAIHLHLPACLVRLNGVVLEDNLPLTLKASQGIRLPSSPTMYGVDTEENIQLMCFKNTADQSSFTVQELRRALNGLATVSFPPGHRYGDTWSL